MELELKGEAVPTKVYIHKIYKIAQLQSYLIHSNVENERWTVLKKQDVWSKHALYIVVYLRKM